jgi:uncharacterized protein (DUF934 family)
MRHILRRREWVADEWRYLGEEAAPEAGLIVPYAQLQADGEPWLTRAGPLGVRLAPVDAVEDLAGVLAHLSLVAVEFPSPGEGRGYTQGRLLRERFGFKGELRALGVQQDQLFLLARCGFDAFDLTQPGEHEAAVRALSRYDVAYQPGAAEVALHRQRFFA